ncbi:MAG: hypothetical protein IKZ34_00795 [Alphaproteobacteria bacterium]|nr:hypothetical protein [Alphaproteobacteria bacterium]
MKKILSFLLAVGVANVAYADDVSFADALRNVRNNCSGISEKLSEIKKLAGVGTAMSAVGTVAGGTAVATGLVKNKFDKVSDNLERQIEMFKSMQVDASTVDVEDFVKLQQDLADLLKNEEFSEYVESLNSDEMDAQKLATVVEETSMIAETENLKEMVDGVSKTVGHVRTGTLAAATATNIAGAVVSGVNKIDADFATQIGVCMGSVKLLSSMKVQAKLDGSASDADIAVADKIIAECDKFNVSDIEKINKRATGATVASSVGAAAGFAGTITSGVANSNSVRTSENAQKEKNLNAASNVLAGVTTAASVTATVFNATQIAAAKRVIETAEKCEEVIK